MYRCLQRTTRALKRSGLSSKSNNKRPFRQLNYLSYNSIRHRAYRHSIFARTRCNRLSASCGGATSTTAAPFLCHKRLFSSNSNDSVHSGNVGQYFDNIFESWKADPNSVEKSWREYFEKHYGYFSNGQFIKDASAAAATSSADGGGGGEISNAAALKMIDDATNLLKLVRAYQSYGHYIAKLDPLGILQQGVDRKQFQPELLNKEFWGFSDADLDRRIFVGDHSQFLSLMGVSTPYVTIRAVEERLRAIYCNTIGYQYMHIANFEKNQFMRHAIERDMAQYEASREEKIRILDRLLWAEEFENFLDVKYPAQKRFGINGAESFVPLLKEIIDEGARLGISDFVIGMPHRGRLLFLAEIIDEGARLGISDFVIGMPHRGRLLFLATVVRKPLWQIFYEFRGLAVPWEQIGDSGDVKYHLGHSLDRKTPDELSVHLSLLPNPSHLEAVDPVVMGKTRAKQYVNGDADRSKTCAIIIHGDASFSGQGVVYETMALTDLPKYTTGGVIHVIVNNQIGFTTDAYDSRSSPYCTDVARSVAAPILHVNGDDPEAVTKSAKIAVRYRQRFKCDAIVDMLCFRRYGHNEGDEPMFTQPTMYKVIGDKIKSDAVVTGAYKQQLIAQQVLTETEVRELELKIRSLMSEAYEASGNKPDIESELRADWLGKNWAQIATLAGSRTAIDVETARYIAESCAPSNFPPQFSVHRKLAKILTERAQSVLQENDAAAIDWGTGEQLAYGSLLLEGVHVRVSGQDCERGTFSHRHCVVHDQATTTQDLAARQRDGRTFTPLAQALKHRENGTAVGNLFQISNSNLSEFGVLGFEYGYSCESPRSLVIWEAQFGDFANGAQVVFDQFISSGELKWLRQSGLCVLLPHGYEGGGPEHSSARIERYLQMCNDDESVFCADAALQVAECNWQCCNVTSPANFFHVLRRQIHRPYRKPLLVFTPKYGLRHPLATSTLDEFVGDTQFQTVIAGACTAADPRQQVQKLVFCSGKIWLNLEEHRKREKLPSDAVVIDRVEQIAPFPYARIREQIERYPNAHIYWVQEEPKNMGAWTYVQPRFATTLRECTGTRQQTGGGITYIGRAPNASPATGYPQVHKAEHNEIIETVFRL
eukprot:CAMPEP_0202730768 /NCGR_PEP_ID=MMETSP1385-20130828/186803_1 /ASSEMBLY_ACC=CAM_ASM_000861 /TAXON_ID=933848 /ORGANISM="Elphidium margaritaceum" /LENGTH=1108 /DNA_ID=CAMNT_0049397047 /DNA_START=48 /DNA_END=3374 /DNA_ORIENTATION=+